MKKELRGTLVLKKDESVVVKMDLEDSERFLELSASLGSIDQIIGSHTGKMPQRDLIVVIEERRKASVAMEKLVDLIYRKYDLNDSNVYAFDATRGEIHQTPTKRPLWRFR